MIKKPIIAVDIDDVIAASTETLRLSINKKHNVELTKDHYRIKGPHRQYYEHVWELNGLGDRANYDDFSAEMTLDQSNVELVEGAEEAIHQLKQKFHLIFITARPIEWSEATKKWFKEKFGDDIELHFSAGYFNEQGKTKGELCKQYGAEWLIDDVPGNCQSAVDEGIHTILFGEYGWHQEIPEGVIHCKTWPEVVKVLTNA